MNHEEKTYFHAGEIIKSTRLQDMQALFQPRLPPGCVLYNAKKAVCNAAAEARAPLPPIIAAHIIAKHTLGVPMQRRNRDRNRFESD